MALFVTKQKDIEPILDRNRLKKLFRRHGRRIPIRENVMSEKIDKPFRTVEKTLLDLGTRFQSKRTHILIKQKVRSVPHQSQKTRRK